LALSELICLVKRTSLLSFSSGTYSFRISYAIPIPPGNYSRFLGLRYTIGVAAYTGGTVDAWLTRSRVDRRVYAAGTTTGVPTLP
jgi:hypothetical protein